MPKPLLVITGATRGIGYAIAQKFAANGYNIATCARTPESLQRMSDEFADTYGVEVFTCVADISKKAEASSFVAFVRQLKQDISVLVNNTGAFSAGSIMEEPKGLMEKMMAVNYYSAYWVTKGLLQSMVSKKGGHIFNMCSVGSITHKPGGGSYFISKQALYGFTKILQEDLRGHGVKVTAVLPSATYTSSWEESGVNPERLIDPADIARTVWDCIGLSPRTQIEEVLIRPPLGDF